MWWEFAEEHVKSGVVTFILFIIAALMKYEGWLPESITVGCIVIYSLVVFCILWFVFRMTDVIGDCVDRFYPEIRNMSFDEAAAYRQGIWDRKDVELKRSWESRARLEEFKTELGRTMRKNVQKDVENHSPALLAKKNQVVVVEGKVIHSNKAVKRRRRK